MSLNILPSEVIDLVLAAKLEERQRVRTIITRLRDVEVSTPASSPFTIAMQGHVVTELNTIINHVLDPEEDWSPERKAQKAEQLELQEELDNLFDDWDDDDDPIV